MHFNEQNHPRKRLTLLRAMNNLSRREMAEKLNKLIGYRGEFCGEGEGLALDEPNGTQVISHIERGHRTITPMIALAYAEIFDVSLDFIFGRVDYTKPKYKSTYEITGLSDNAIRNLESINSTHAKQEEAINRFNTEQNQSYNFMSLIISDHAFWDQFNKRMSVIWKFKNSKAKFKIMEEEDQIIMEFKELLSRLFKRL